MYGFAVTICRRKNVVCLRGGAIGGPTEKSTKLVTEKPHHLLNFGLEVDG